MHVELAVKRARIAELETQLKIAQGTIASLRDYNERAPKLAAEEANRQVGELEARLDAIDGALDDADAPDATESHALDNDPIIERVKLWRHVQCALVEQAETRLKEANEALEHKVEIAPDDLLATMLARAEKAEADAGRLRGVLAEIIKRTQDCAPLVATDVRQMAQAALRPAEAGEEGER